MSACLVRLIWIALALLVPVGIGLAVWMRRRRRSDPHPGLVQFPAAFPSRWDWPPRSLLLVTVPVLRVVSALRGHRDVHVPLVTTPESYALAASLVAGSLRRHGIDVMALPPPWWIALPTRILTRLGGGAFSRLEQTAYFRGRALEAALYPNALLLRGTPTDTARAHALVVEAVTGHPDMFQTSSPDAQDLERQIQRVWAALRREPEAHVEAAPLLSRLEDIAAEMARVPLDFDEWQVVYRQVLQLERALRGERQVLEATLPGGSSRPAPGRPPSVSPGPATRGGCRRRSSSRASRKRARCWSRRKWRWRARSSNPT